MLKGIPKLLTQKSSMYPASLMVQGMMTHNVSPRINTDRSMEIQNLLRDGWNFL